MFDLVFAVLGVLLLLGCCHRCCLPAIVRGFAGRWAQLHFTHSNAHIPPLYLPKQQRLAIGAALHADDGTPRKTLTTEGAVLGTSRDVRVATLLRVTIVKQQPDQPVGLQLVDLVTDANGWRRENGSSGEYYVHVKSRTTLAASPEKWELAPRVHSMDSSSLAARSEQLQIGDAVLSVNGCTGDAAFLTNKLSAAQRRVKLLIERTAREEDQAPTDAGPATDPPKCAGRRDPGWVEAKIGWWSHQQGALSEAWSQRWSRNAAPESPGRPRSQGDSATSRVAVSTDTQDTPDARLAVPSAELRLGCFGRFQLRRELRPAQRPRAGVGEWRRPGREEFDAAAAEFEAVDAAFAASQPVRDETAVVIPVLRNQLELTDAASTIEFHAKLRRASCVCERQDAARSNVSEMPVEPVAHVPHHVGQ